MKASIYRRVGLYLVTTFIVSNISFSQSLNFMQWHNPKFPIPDYREDNGGNKTYTVPFVSSKTLDAFAKMFKGASDVRWFELDNKFLVKFRKDGRENTALFNAKGMHIYTISYGSEKNLPMDIKQRVKTAYFDYLITLVVEVNSLGATAWITKLEDKKRIIILKVADDEMEETENYLKSK